MDFDLELLRQGIKGRFSITGHGDHAFQKAMAKMNLQEEFYGHVVEIQDSRNAVWFKLNYDNIGRGTTKYLGGWKDLDAQFVEDRALRFKEYEKRLNELNSRAYTLRTQMAYLLNFNKATSGDPLPNPLTQEMLAKALEFRNAIEKAQLDLGIQISDEKKKMELLQEEVRTYMAERKS
jgi:hypothetical protein